MKKASEFLCDEYSEIPLNHKVNYIILIYIEDNYDRNIIKKNIIFCTENNIRCIIKRNKSKYIIDELFNEHDIIVVIENDYIPNYIDILLFIISKMKHSKVMINKNHLYCTAYLHDNFSVKYSILYLKDDILNPLEINSDKCHILNIKHNKYIMRLDEKYKCNQNKLILSDKGTEFIINNNETFTITYKNEFLHSHHIKFSEDEYETTTTSILDASSEWILNKTSMINKHLNTNLSVNNITLNITSKHDNVHEWILV